MSKYLLDFFKNILRIRQMEPPKPENIGTSSKKSKLFSTDFFVEQNAQRLADHKQQVFDRNFQRKASQDIPRDMNIAMDAAASPIKLGVNEAFGTVPDTQLNWYSSQAFIGYQMCAILAQHWLISKACTLPGEDALRNGYEISVNNGVEVSPGVLDRLKVLDQYFKLNYNLEQFSKFNRVFGIRIAIFDIDVEDPDDYYLKPFNLDGIGPYSYKGISQVDPYWITPELSNRAAVDPSAIDFYEPTWWRVNGRRIHRSHLVIIRHDEVADILKPTYLYGGIPLPQKIYERVYAAERTANEAPILALTKRLNVYKTDLEAALANQGAFEQKLQQQVQMRDNYGVKIIGFDEEAQQFDLNLTDLDVTIMTQYQLTSAIANMPAQKLFGTTPKGFNSTGEYEESSYHELLETIQTHNYTPFVERHHEILIRSHICPEFGIKPFKTTVLWNKLDSYTAKEQAEINEIDSRTDTNLINAGVIDGQEVRDRLISNKNSGYSGLEADKIIEAPGLGGLFENDPETSEIA